MVFNGLMVGDFIHWSYALRDNWHLLEYSQLWVNEPLECFLEVVGLNRSEDVGEIEFECVRGCGRHGVSTLTIQEYDGAVEALGNELFEPANSIEEFASVFISEPEEKNIADVYNLEEDINTILKML